MRARGARAFTGGSPLLRSNNAFDCQPDRGRSRALLAMRAALTDAAPYPARLGSSPLTAPARRSTTASSRSDTALLGECAPPILLQSAIGHLLGAAGPTEALVDEYEALRRELTAPDESTTGRPTRTAILDYLGRGPRSAPGVSLALSNSFGFGGQNACLRRVAGVGFTRSPGIDPARATTPSREILDAPPRGAGRGALRAHHDRRDRPPRVRRPRDRAATSTSRTSARSSTA